MKTVARNLDQKCSKCGKTRGEHEQAGLRCPQPGRWSKGLFQTFQTFIPEDQEAPKVTCERGNGQ